MKTRTPKIKKPDIVDKIKIKELRQVNHKTPNRIIRFFNKRLVEKYIDIKQPKKLDVLFGVICNELLSLNKKYPAPEANLRK